MKAGDFSSAVVEVNEGVEILDGLGTVATVSRAQDVNEYLLRRWRVSGQGRLLGGSERANRVGLRVL